MKNFLKRTLITASLVFLSACGVNDKGYKLWEEGLSSGSRIQYCYYVKVTDESTTYYDAFAFVPGGGGFWPVYTNFKYVDGDDSIAKIEKEVYTEKLQAVKNGELKGSYGKLVDNR